MPRCQAQLFAPDNADPMVALNGAMMTDGARDRGRRRRRARAAAAHRSYRQRRAAGGDVHAFAVLKLGTGASATLVESYIAGEGAKAIRSMTR